MNALNILLGVVLTVLFLGWIGLKINPKPYPAFSQKTPVQETFPLPDGLPAPVERFYRQFYHGESLPVIKTFVASGRGWMRLFGLTWPMRFRFYHQVGNAYRSLIEATLFGLPLIKADELYRDGHFHGVTPGGVQEGAKYDQGANLRLWAEAVGYAPAYLLQDPRVKWEAMDDVTALLVAPFDSSLERFVVRFDPESGAIRLVESMRYKGDGEKDLWINKPLDEGKTGEILVPARSQAIWVGNAPWLELVREEIVFNVEVADRMQGI